MLDTWAGRLLIPDEVIGETPRRFRVRLLKAANLPGRPWRHFEAGAEALVPKYAICSSPIVKNEVRE